MNRYTVWHTTGKFDGDDGFDDLEKARAEFEHQKTRTNVVQVEMMDTSDASDPKPIDIWIEPNTHDD